MKIKTTFLSILSFLLISCSPKLTDSISAENEKPALHELFKTQNFEWIGTFKNSKAIAQINGESILIDEFGKKIMDYPYNDKQPYFFEEYLIVSNGSMSKIIDLDGNEIVPADYTNLNCICDCGYFRATKDGQTGILNFTDKKFHPIENISVFSTATKSGELLIKNEKTKTYDLVSLNGNTVKNIPYSFVSQIANGNFIVKNKDMALLLDSKAENIISKTYDKFDLCRSKNIIVELNKKEGIIDGNGVELISPKYDRISEFYGHFIIRDSTVTGLMDENLNIVYKFENHNCKSSQFYPPYFSVIPILQR